MSLDYIQPKADETNPAHLGSLDPFISAAFKKIGISVCIIIYVFRRTHFEQCVCKHFIDTKHTTEYTPRISSMKIISFHYIVTKLCDI